MELSAPEGSFQLSDINDIMDFSTCKVFEINEDEKAKFIEYVQNPASCGTAMKAHGLSSPRGENFMYIITKASAMRALQLQNKLDSATVILGSKTGHMRDEQKEAFTMLMADPKAAPQVMQINQELDSISCVDMKKQEFQVVFAITTDILEVIHVSNQGGRRRRGPVSAVEKAAGSDGVSVVNTLGRTVTACTGEIKEQLEGMLKGAVEPKFNRFDVLECPAGAFAVTSVKKMCALKAQGANVLLNNKQNSGYFAGGMRTNQEAEFKELIEKRPTAGSSLKVEDDQLFSPDNHGNKFPVIVWVGKDVFAALKTL